MCRALQARISAGTGPIAENVNYFSIINALERLIRLGVISLKTTRDDLSHSARSAFVHLLRIIV